MQFQMTLQAFGYIVILHDLYQACWCHPELRGALPSTNRHGVEVHLYSQVGLLSVYDKVGAYRLYSPSEDK